MENTTAKTKDVKIAFQDPDSGLFEIDRLGSNEPKQKLTEEEFQKLESLMPDVNWIVIQWVKPTEYKMK